MPSILLSSHWLFAGLANGLVIYIIGRLLVLGYREHAYLYQLDERSRLLDRWIKALLPMAQRLKLARYRRIVARDLGRAANLRGWDSDHFLASQLVYAGVALVVTYILLCFLLGVTTLVLPVAAAIAALLPFMRLHDLATRRWVSCNRDLPYFIDYLTLAMGAGLDFNQALATVVADAPASPLADEFRLVLRNMRLGMSRAEALREMDLRLDSPALKLFAQTMIQAMELGSDVNQTLRVISENMQQRRFQAAEEMAGKISVRMMIPLMCFVLPSVMIILLGPMILSSPLFH